MANVSFHERLMQDLQILVDGGPAISHQKIELVCRMTVSKIEGKLGQIPAFDDVNKSAGDQEVLGLALRIAKQFLIDDSHPQTLFTELDEIRQSRVQEESTPVVVPADKTPRTRRTW